MAGEENIKTTRLYLQDQDFHCMYLLITVMLCLRIKHFVNQVRIKIQSLHHWGNKFFFDTLKKENKLLKCKNSNIKTTPFFSHSRIKTDKKMNFYTGIWTFALFNAIFSLLLPYLNTLKYWHGWKVTYCTKRRYHMSSERLLSHIDELLMVLLRCRLGLLNEHVADRFWISTCTAWSALAT